MEQFLIRSSRNTSTCVEKTLFADRLREYKQKHLHVRGEDTRHKACSASLWETPPHAWRRQGRAGADGFEHGNTSTCVEKTTLQSCRLRLCGKHLHVRGEDLDKVPETGTWLETPPRAWRRPDNELNQQIAHGNTSTCVEKTLSTVIQYKQDQKHLHVRGEDSVAGIGSVSRRETPPRAWRRQSSEVLTYMDSGNTSTCVEKTKK